MVPSQNYLASVIGTMPWNTKFCSNKIQLFAKKKKKESNHLTLGIIRGIQRDQAHVFKPITTSNNNHNHNKLLWRLTSVCSICAKNIWWADIVNIVCGCRIYKQLYRSSKKTSTSHQLKDGRKTRGMVGTTVTYCKWISLCWTGSWTWEPSRPPLHQPVTPVRRWGSTIFQMPQSNIYTRQETPSLRYPYKL